MVPLSCKGQALQDELDCLDRIFISNTFIRNVGTFNRWQCLIQKPCNPSLSYFASNSIYFFILSPVRFSFYFYFLYCAVFSCYFSFSLFSILICPSCFTYLMPFPLSSRLFHCTVFFSPTTSTWFCLNLEPTDVSIFVRSLLLFAVPSVHIKPCSSKERNSFSELLLFFLVGT